MRVDLIAYTVVMGWDAMRDAGWVENDYTLGGMRAPTVYPPDELAEFAGRACYQSWDRPNPATATNAGYLANIIAQRHFSVLEHASATFYVQGVSRSLTHELVRHRHLSFSQLSQRYVDESRATFVTPPAITEYVARLATQVGYDAQAFTSHLRAVSDTATEAYQRIVSTLQAGGLTRKEARQAARCVLPNATETKILVTGNMRAWRDVIEKRDHPAADAEIRLLAQEILRQLKEVAPNTFQDM